MLYRSADDSPRKRLPLQAVSKAVSKALSPSEEDSEDRE